jgi:flagellar hook protein FlgE
MATLLFFCAWQFTRVATAQSTNVTWVTTNYFTFRTNTLNFLRSNTIVSTTRFIWTVTNWVTFVVEESPSGSETNGIDPIPPWPTILGFEDPGMVDYLGILGPGYFVVRDPIEDRQFVTRSTDFLMDGSGFVIIPNGIRLQGFAGADLSQVGDLQIDGQGRPSWADPQAVPLSFHFQADGRLVVKLTDGTEFTRGQLLLQSFGNPSALLRVDFMVWEITDAARPLPRPVPPSAEGPGLLGVDQPVFDVTLPSMSVERVENHAGRFVQGLLYDAGAGTDAGIRGRGFFVVREPNSNQRYATRLGAFYVDPSGYLATYAGLRVQGRTNDSVSTIGDLRVDASADPRSGETRLLNSLGISSFGKISGYLEDYTVRDCGRVLLTDCTCTQGLVSTNSALYVMDQSTGPWMPLAAPGNAGLGWVAEGSVELCQFDENTLSIWRRLNAFGQRGITPTGSPTDLALAGGGFFIVRDPGNGASYATRSGRFHRDSLGYLVTTNGLRVQGLTDPERTVPGDVQIDTVGMPATSDPNATLAFFWIYGNGQIEVHLSDGTQFVRGQILAQSFRNLLALQETAYDLCSNLEAALPLPANCPPTTHGLGAVEQGALERDTPAMDLALLPTSGFRLLVSDLASPTAEPSTVEASDDAVHWESLGPITLSANCGLAEIFDTEAVPRKARFYRIRVSYPTAEQGAQTWSRPLGYFP